jgi:hypothetical protein
MKMMKFLIIPLLIVALLGFGMNSFASLHSKWSSGDLIFYDGATDIFTVKDSTDGLMVHDDINLTFGDDSDATIEYDEDGTNKLILTCSNGFTLAGGLGFTGDILMATTSKIQFHDTGLYINASGNGALVISSDGTLAVGATTSYTLTSPAVKFIATTSIVHELDASNYVTQTIGATGLVTVTTTGDADGSYEIVADDTTIVLDANTTISLEAGAGTYGFSATTFDMNALTITDVGDIECTNAAGPTLQNEAASITNPTLIPNRADETTGIGWNTAEIHLVISGGDEYDFGATALDMNSNNLEEVGTYGGTGAITISPGAAGTFLDFVLETEWVSGTLINADFANATTLTGAAIGLNLDFSAVHVDSDQDIKAIDLTFPDLTFDAVSKSIKGLEISGDTITQTTSGTSVWTGVDITIPTLVETAGTLTGYGFKIVGGTLTTDPISYGLHLSGNFTTGIAVTGTYSDEAISIGGTYDHGIRFTEDMVAGDVTNSFINIGDYTTAIAVAPAGANMFGEMHNVTLTDVDVAYWYQAKYTKITTSGTTTATSIAGHALRINVATNLEAVYGIQCHTLITAGADVTQEVVSVSAYVDMGTGDTTTDRVVALQAMISGSGTAGTVTGLMHVAYIANRGTVIDTDAIIFINNGTASTSDVAVEFDLDGTVTNVWEFNGTVCDAFTTADIGSSTEYGARDEYVLIPVAVEGVTPQLYIIAAETWVEITP